MSGCRVKEIDHVCIADTFVCLGVPFVVGCRFTFARAFLRNPKLYRYFGRRDVGRLQQLAIDYYAAEKEQQRVEILRGLADRRGYELGDICPDEFMHQVGAHLLVSLGKS